MFVGNINMAKTKAEVAKMVKEQKMTTFGKLSLTQQRAKLKSLNGSAKGDTAVGKIEIGVLKQLIIKGQKAAPKKTGRTYQYTVYLPEDYSDDEALKFWKQSQLGSMKSGVELSKELTAEGGRPIFDKGTYHVFTAKKPYTIAEWKLATKGRPTGFVSETGKNYGYTGGIVKKVTK